MIAENRIRIENEKEMWGSESEKLYDNQANICVDKNGAMGSVAGFLGLTSRRKTKCQ